MDTQYAQFRNLCVFFWEFYVCVYVNVCRVGGFTMTISSFCSLGNVTNSSHLIIFLGDSFLLCASTSRAQMNTFWLQSV